MAWNGSQKQGVVDGHSVGGKQAIPKANKCILRRIIFVGTVIIPVIAITCYWLNRDQPSAPEMPTKKKPVVANIQDTAPSLPSPKPVVPEKPKRVTKFGTPIPDNVFRDERGEWMRPNGMRWVDTNNVYKTKRKPHRRLFTRHCDNDIAAMLKRDPTKMAPILIGKLGHFDERFVNDFRESLKNPEVVDVNDTPEEAELRKSVNEVKAELKQRMDAGEDIAKIMNETQEEIDRLCQYQHDLEAQINKIRYDETISDADYEDYIKAANEMLKKQGLGNVKFPILLKRQARIKRMKERIKAQEN